MHKMICVVVLTTFSSPGHALESLAQLRPPPWTSLPARVMSEVKNTFTVDQAPYLTHSFFPYALSYRIIDRRRSGREFGVHLRYQWE